MVAGRSLQGSGRSGAEATRRAWSGFGRCGLVVGVRCSGGLPLVALDGVSEVARIVAVEQPHSAPALDAERMVHAHQEAHVLRAGVTPLVFAVELGAAIGRGVGAVLVVHARSRARRLPSRRRRGAIATHRPWHGRQRRDRGRQRPGGAIATRRRFATGSGASSSRRSGHSPMRWAIRCDRCGNATVATGRRTGDGLCPPAAGRYRSSP